MKNLSNTDISQIKYIAKQSNGRWRLICNLYNLTLDDLRYILLNPE